MKTKILIFLGFIAAIHSAFCQHKINLVLADGKSTDTKLTVSYWEKGEKNHYMYTSMESGRVNISIDDSIPCGIINVSFPDYEQFSNINLLYTHNDIEIEITPLNNSQFIISGDDETSEYYYYKNKIDSLTQRIGKIIRISYSFQEDIEFQNTTNSFIEHDKKVIDSIYEYINNNFNDFYFTHLLNASHMAFPDITQNINDQKLEILRDFFLYFDPSDTIVLNSPIYLTKIDDYFTIFSGINTDDANNYLKKAVDNFMGKIISSEKIVFPVASLMRKWLNQYGFDEVIQYIDINYLSTQCNSGDDKMLQERLASYERLSVGNTAPEIKWTDNENIIHSLYEINSERTIIVFWATWCTHCQQVIPVLYKYSNENPEITVIAVNLEQDNKAYEASKAQYNKWIHIQATGSWNNEWVKLYGVYATPVIYILNKEHKIIRKAKNMEEITSTNQ